MEADTVPLLGQASPKRTLCFVEDDSVAKKAGTQEYGFRQSHHLSNCDGSYNYFNGPSRRDRQENTEDYRYGTACWFLLLCLAPLIKKIFHLLA